MALDLAAIEQRQQIALLGPGHVEPLLVREDVPALIAEVREVTRQRDDAAARLKSLLVLRGLTNLHRPTSQDPSRNGAAVRYVGLTQRRDEPHFKDRHFVEAEDAAGAWAYIRAHLPSDWEIVWVHETTPAAHLANGHVPSAAVEAGER